MPTESGTIETVNSPHASDVAEASPALFTSIRVYDLPPNAQQSEDVVGHLFSRFGRVREVTLCDSSASENVANKAALDDIDKGDSSLPPLSSSSTYALVEFRHESDAQRCLNSIVQHDLLEEITADDGAAAAAETVMERHRGYIFCGYARLLIDGVIRQSVEGLQPRSDAVTTTSKSSSPLQSPSLTSRKRPRGADDAASASETNKHISSDDDDDDESDATSEASEEEAVHHEAAPATKDEGCSSSATPASPPTSSNIVVLRVVEEPLKQQQQASKPIDLSPFIVFQILRDVCLPMKIVLCTRKEQQPQQLSNSGEYRKVLVQVDRRESVDAVLDRYRYPTVVELRDGADIKNTLVAARYRIRALPHEVSNNNANELHVAVNRSNCLSVTAQGITKMGGVFERHWKDATPCSGGEVCAVSSVAHHHHHHHHYHHMTNPHQAHPQQQYLHHSTTVSPPQPQHFRHASEVSRPSLPAYQQPTLTPQPQLAAITVASYPYSVQQAPQPPPPPPPLPSRQEGLSSDWTVEPVLSPEYQRTYYVARHRITHETFTSWEFPVAPPPPPGGASSSFQ